MDREPAVRNLKTARPRARLTAGRADWYRITNLAGEGGAPADVMIYDEVGYFGVTAQDFMTDLKAITAPQISLRINSPGGEIFDGIAIYNCLQSHPANVTVYVDSLAASIASVIAMAGDRIVMQPHSQMMIHEGAGMCIGDAADMRELADLLDRSSDNIAGIYAERAGGSVKQWRERMRAETWYTAAEAVEAGLADEAAKPKKKMPPMPTDNSWDLSVFRYQGRDQAPAPDPAPDTTPDVVPEVVGAAVGPHGGVGKEGTWDASAEQAKLPSPMTVATARNMYALYDSARVENGELPKDACSLPHHFVNTDGTPGAASLSGVSAALGRLNQTQGYTDAEKATAERHLRGHQPSDSATDHLHTHDADGEIVEVIPWDNWDPVLFRNAVATAANDFSGWDPDAFRNAVTVAAADAPAEQPPPVVEAPYEGPPAPTQPEEPAPADPDFVYDPDAFRHAVRTRAEDAPAVQPATAPEPPYEGPPPEATPPEPAGPPVVEGFEGYDPDVFRASVRLRADNAPAVAPQAVEQQEQPDLYDPTVVTRALREAAR